MLLNYNSTWKLEAKMALIWGLATITAAEMLGAHGLLLSEQGLPA